MTQSYLWWARYGQVLFGTSVQALPYEKNGLTLRCTRQVHGNRVLDDETFGGCDDEADGLVTDLTDHVLLVRTADCVPVMVTDGHRVGAYHAGWRGTKAGIVAEIGAHFAPPSAKVLIGPAICMTCYEVGPDLYEPWLAADARVGPFLHPGRTTEKRQLDLVGFVVQQLHDRGFREIRRQPGCTFGSALPSYRRQGQKAARLQHVIVHMQNGVAPWSETPLLWESLPQAVVGQPTGGMSACQSFSK